MDTERGARQGPRWPSLDTGREEWILCHLWEVDIIGCNPGLQHASLAMTLGELHMLSELQFLHV